MRNLLDSPIVFTLRPVLLGVLLFYAAVLTLGLSTHLMAGPRDHGPLGHVLGLVGVALSCWVLRRPREEGEG